jgi:hypothetical protein
MFRTINTSSVINFLERGDLLEIHLLKSWLLDTFFKLIKLLKLAVVPGIAWFLVWQTHKPYMYLSTNLHYNTLPYPTLPYSNPSNRSLPNITLGAIQIIHVNFSNHFRLPGLPCVNLLHSSVPSHPP